MLRDGNPGFERQKPGAPGKRKAKEKSRSLTTIRKKRGWVRDDGKLRLCRTYGPRDFFFLVPALTGGAKQWRASGAEDKRAGLKPGLYITETAGAHSRRVTLALELAHR